MSSTGTLSPDAAVRRLMGPGFDGPVALSPSELADRVEQVTERMSGLPFTATPTQDLDAMGVWARLQDQATAGMWRAITAATNRAGGYQRAFIADEVALSTRWSGSRAASETDMAHAVCSLPGLVEAVEAGVLTAWHARVIVRELEQVELSLEQRQAIVLITLARYQGADPHRLGKHVRSLILTIDPAAAAARKTVADGRRQVRCWATSDGQGVLQLSGPLEQLAAALEALRAQASTPAEPGDERSTDQRLFDTALQMLAGDVTDPAHWQLSVIIPYSVTQGGDLEVAEIPGHGPILPSTARDLAQHAGTAQRVAVDTYGHVLAVDDPQPGPAAGRRRSAARQQPAAPEPTDTWEAWVQGPLADLAAQPVVTRDLSTGSYQVPRRLKRFLEARDRTCTFPTCWRPASHTDKDHALPWPLGPTSESNLGCLCRHHHRAKQASFTLRRLPNGTTRWITRGRQRHDRPPEAF